MYWKELPEVAKKHFKQNVFGCFVVLIMAYLLAKNGLISSFGMTLFIIADFIAFFAACKQAERYRREAREKENFDRVAASVTSSAPSRSDATRRFCSSCGHELSESSDVRFCPYCGKEL